MNAIYPGSYTRSYNTHFRALLCIIWRSRNVRFAKRARVFRALSGTCLLFEFECLVQCKLLDRPHFSFSSRTFSVRCDRAMEHPQSGLSDRHATCKDLICKVEHSRRLLYKATLQVFIWRMKSLWTLDG